MTQILPKKTPKFRKFNAKFVNPLQRLNPLQEGFQPFEGIVLTFFDAEIFIKLDPLTINLFYFLRFYPVSVSFTK